MNKMQEQVTEFHRKFGHPVGATPQFLNPLRVMLRKRLIRSETFETIDAIDEKNLVEMMDGACDILYVVIGMAVECGIDLEPLFDEVHRSNMTKEGGGKDSDGKTLKPPGWTPPDISRMIQNQREQPTRYLIESKTPNDPPLVTELSRLLDAWKSGSINLWEFERQVGGLSRSL